jgi:hypothetical protein
MTGSFAVALSAAAASVAAWAVHRYELRREPAPTACATVLNDVYAEGTSTVPDSLLLAQLLEHRDQCMSDASYVFQVRRLMLNTQRPDDARALLQIAEQRGTLTPDEVRSEEAWIDLAAAHIEWANGSEPRADELRARALSTANDLRKKWPEWSFPYLILEEAGRTNWKQSDADHPNNYLQQERSARTGILNGAFVRGLDDWEPALLAFVVVLVGMLGACAGVSGLLEIREMSGLSTSAIAAARSGYVELKGVLHPLSRASTIASEANARSVWYEIERRTGVKASRTTFERSVHPFVLRDSTGDVVIEPSEMTVRTRHRTSKIAGGGSLGSGTRVIERMLWEGDDAYALGELTIATGTDGATDRRLSVAENGRRLLVSNLSEEQLSFFARLWFWLGAVVFGSALIVLIWAFYERYHVVNIPGVLK